VASDVAGGAGSGGERGRREVTPGLGGRRRGRTSKGRRRRSARTDAAGSEVGRGGDPPGAGKERPQRWRANRERRFPNRGRTLAFPTTLRTMVERGSAVTMSGRSQGVWFAFLAQLPQTQHERGPKQRQGLNGKHYHLPWLHWIDVFEVRSVSP